MVRKSQYNLSFDNILSEQEKKRKGWDMRSFSRRMAERLRKVRGDDSSSDSFLTRHHYQKSNSLA